MNLDQFTRRGVAYVSKPSKPNSCDGCAFNQENCTHDHDPSCHAGKRADHCDVIFVHAPAADAHKQMDLIS